MNYRYITWLNLKTLLHERNRTQSNICGMMPFMLGLKTDKMKQHVVQEYIQTIKNKKINEK